MTTVIGVIALTRLSLRKALWVAARPGTRVRRVDAVGGDVAEYNDIVITPQLKRAFQEQCSRPNLR